MLKTISPSYVTGGNDYSDSEIIDTNDNYYKKNVIISVSDSEEEAAEVAEAEEEADENLTDEIEQFDLKDYLDKNLTMVSHFNGNNIFPLEKYSDALINNGMDLIRNEYNYNTIVSLTSSNDTYDIRRDLYASRTLLHEEFEFNKFDNKYVKNVNNDKPKYTSKSFGKYLSKYIDTLTIIGSLHVVDYQFCDENYYRVITRIYIGSKLNFENTGEYFFQKDINFLDSY